MENKIIIVVTVALIIGLVAGYALNYVIYQPQIQRLQDEATNYQSQITNYQSQINNLTAIIANTHNSPSPTPTSAASSSPSPTGTPSSTPTPTHDQLEFTTLPTADNNSAIFHIFFGVQNVGSSTATLNYIYLNTIPDTNFPGLTGLLINGYDYSNSAINVQMKPGDVASCTMTLNSVNQSYTSGTVFAVAVGTASGSIFTCPNEVQLP
jgi:hypothetical protein